MNHRDIVAIGASAGGFDALQSIAKELPADFPASIFVVVHLASFSPFLLPGLLNRVGPLMAVETQDRMTIQPGRIYVAPPDHHLLLSPGHLHLAKGPRENLARPSLDPLFRTAAQHYGRRVIGVVLTGNLDDGASGLLAVQRRGGVTVVQDPDDARFPGMPQAALRHVRVDHRVPLQAIPALLLRLVQEEIPSVEKEGPVPAQLIMEARFPSMEAFNALDAMASIGTPVPYSCPECHGPLWKMLDEGPLRFRCHVGHGFTGESMEVGQAASLEAGLWDVLRLLRERISLLRVMAARAGTENRPQDRRTWESRAEALEQDAKAILRMLTEGRASDARLPSQD